MSLRYRYLVLDHDDTAVDSTATVHYPAHRRAMELLRPEREPIDLDGWFLKNFDPGIMPYLSEELGMSAPELEQEYRIWREFTTRTRPPFFPGFLETLAAFRGAGGSIAVVSHSEKELILQDYLSGGQRQLLLPELVFGWDTDPSRRKPSSWPLEQVLEGFAAAPEEVLVLDDLKPGVLMAQAAAVDAAGAGWAHQIPEIRRFMQVHCVAYFETVADFREFLLGS